MTLPASVQAVRDRVPSVEALADAVVQAALDDAATLLDEGQLDERGESAHVYRAAHILARRGLIAPDTPVTSRRAGEIAVAMAIRARDETLAETRWGVLFLEIMETVTAPPVTA